MLALCFSSDYPLSHDACKFYRTLALSFKIRLLAIFLAKFQLECYQHHRHYRVRSLVEHLLHHHYHYLHCWHFNNGGHLFQLDCWPYGKDFQIISFPLLRWVSASVSRQRRGFYSLQPVVTTAVIGLKDDDANSWPLLEQFQQHHGGKCAQLYQSHLLGLGQS